MSAILEYTPLLLKGLWVTVQLVALSSILTVIIAFVAGLGRLSRHRVLRVPAAVFVEVFRGTSLIVQLFWFFYVLPAFGVYLPAFAVGVVALALNGGAYAAEIVRGTIASRPRGQTEACIALGIPPAKRMRRILIPQSIPAMLPPFGNVVIDLLKNSALVATITVLDLTYVAKEVVRANTGETVAVFVLLLLIYFALSAMLSMVVSWMERRFAFTGRGVK